MDRPVRDEGDLREFLAQVKFNPSCVNLDWEWEIKSVAILEDVPDMDYGRRLSEEEGWFVRTSFVRPDTNTGEVQRGFGRWEYIASGATESAVVKTCWVLAKMIVEHELMEAFTYKGVRIFDPHHTVEELSLPHRIRTKEILLPPSHTIYGQLGIKSGRLDSSKPNPVNPPREEPREVSWDIVNKLIDEARRRHPERRYTRGEIGRLGSKYYDLLKQGVRDGHAVTCEDEFDRTKDVYTEWAAKIFDIHPNEVPAAARNWVKVQTFTYTFSHAMLNATNPRAVRTWLEFLQELVELGLGPNLEER